MFDCRSANLNIAELTSLSDKELRELAPQLREVTEQYKRSELIQKALFDISELSGSVNDLSALYPALHSIISNLMDAQNFFVALYEADEDMMDFVYFVDQFDEMTARTQPAHKLSSGITGHVLRTGQPLFLTKEDTKKTLIDLGIKAIGTAHVDWIGVPLKRGEEVIGAMVVQSYDETIRYSQSEVDVLVFVSQHIITSIDRVKSRELTEQKIVEGTKQLREANQELQEEIKERKKVEALQKALYQISELSNSVEGDISQFYQQLHRILGSLLSAPNCYIAIYDSKKGSIAFPYYADEIEHDVSTRAMGMGLTEYVLRSGEAELVSPTRAVQLVDEGKLSKGLHEKMVQKQNYWMGAPLVIEGKSSGVIAVQNYGETAGYTQQDLDLLRFVSHHIAVAVERKKHAKALQAYNQQLAEKVKERTKELDHANVDLKKQIEERKKIELKLIHDANHDSLTDLPNRAMFNARLQLAIANKQRHPSNNFAVLFIDLDRFKQINDTLGHQAGDQFLIEVGKRIKTCVREHDLLARLGGDEFIILVDSFEETMDVEDVASRIISSLAEAFILDGKEMYSGASIGIAYIESGYQSADEIIRDADAAMYQAKNIGRGRFIIYDKSMRAKLLEEMQLENDFRHAFKSASFDCFTQPCVSLVDNSVLYQECYVRWQHPTVGRVDRAHFLQVAEHCGLTTEVDEYLLQQACSILAEWQSAGGEKATQQLAINISIHHLVQPKLVDHLLTLIKNNGVDPKKLIFELDENELNRRLHFMLPHIQRLKQAGITLVLDNFGSGLASLNYLYNYPFDYVKVDRGIVKSLPHSQRNEKLIQSLISISQNLDFNLIAEGIESQFQLENLRRTGCLYGQGKYLGEAQKLEHHPRIVNAIELG